MWLCFLVSFSLLISSCLFFSREFAPPSFSFSSVATHSPTLLIVDFLHFPHVIPFPSLCKKGALQGPGFSPSLWGQVVLSIRTSPFITHVSWLLSLQTAASRAFTRSTPICISWPLTLGPFSDGRCLIQQVFAQRALFISVSPADLYFVDSPYWRIWPPTGGVFFPPTLDFPSEIHKTPCWVWVILCYNGLYFPEVFRFTLPLQKAPFSVNLMPSQLVGVLQISTPRVFFSLSLLVVDTHSWCVSQLFRLLRGVLSPFNMPWFPSLVLLRKTSFFRLALALDLPSPLELQPKVPYFVWCPLSRPCALNPDFVSTLRSCRLILSNA